MNTGQVFDAEIRRPFPVHEHCFDCTELYHGCKARPASTDFACRDYFPLPVVGIDGRTGQEIPPSRMKERRRSTDIAGGPTREPLEPRLPRSQSRSPDHLPEPIEQTQTTETPAPAKPKAKPTDGANGRTPSPAASYGPDGERLCECGAALKKRQRCCEACRQKRRESTMQRRRTRERPVATVDAA